MESGDMENDGLDDVFAAMNPPATEEPAVVDAVVPGSESAPIEQTPEPVAVDASPSPTSESVVIESSPVEAAVIETPVQTQPSPIDWNHPELKVVREQAQAHQQLMAGIEEAKRLKAHREFQERMSELADGDPERLQQINGLVANATTPLVQQMQQYEQHLHGTQKEFTAFIVAAKAVLPEETFQQIAQEMAPLLTVEGAEAMESIAFGKKQTIQTYESKLATQNQRIKALELQIAAGAQLAERGDADRVDSGGGSPSGDNRRSALQNAKTEDEYFATLFGLAP